MVRIDCTITLELQQQERVEARVLVETTSSSASSGVGSELQDEPGGPPAGTAVI